MIPGWFWDFGFSMWVVSDDGPEFWVMHVPDQDYPERAFGSALGILTLLMVGFLR